MTTEQHLQKIKAKFESLMAIAEKRTPGEWTLFCNHGERPGIECGNTSIVIIGLEDRWDDDAGVRGRDEEEAVHNASFIASCAGNAEAGWHATIAAIDFILMVIEFHTDRPSKPVQLTELETVEAIAEEIITAWSEKLL